MLIIGRQLEYRKLFTKGHERLETLFKKKNYLFFFVWEKKVNNKPSVAVLRDPVIFTVAPSGVMTWTFAGFDTGFTSWIEY